MDKYAERGLLWTGFVLFMLFLILVGYSLYRVFRENNFERLEEEEEIIEAI